MVITNTQRPLWLVRLPPSKVFADFHHNKITRKEEDYIAAYGNEDVVLDGLVKHFENYGYKKLKTKSFSVGD